jgi:hypothetical protein
VAPEWLQSVVPVVWYERYAKRIEDTRLPREQTKRDAYAQTVGEDGFDLLDELEAPEAPPELRTLPIIDTLRRTWQRHYERPAGGAPRGLDAHPPREVVYLQPAGNSIARKSGRIPPFHHRVRGISHGIGPVFL